MYALELAGTLNWFASPASKVSSHWVIDRDGTKVRVIPDDKQAWHAGEHNATHWGIELCQGVESDGFPAAQIAALVEVCKGYVEMGVLPMHAFAGFIGHEETPQGSTIGKTDPGDLFLWGNFIEALQTPPPAEPTLADTAYAFAAYIDFVRRGWDLKDLNDADKAAIKAAAGRVP